MKGVTKPRQTSINVSANEIRLIEQGIKTAYITEVTDAIGSTAEYVDGYIYDNGKIILPVNRMHSYIFFREPWAKDDMEKIHYKSLEPDYRGKWLANVSMSAETARIWGQVNDIRACRLDEITDSEAKAAGFYGRDDLLCQWDAGVKARRKNKQKFGRDANPWIWIIFFELISRPDNIYSRIRRLK